MSTERQVYNDQIENTFEKPGNMLHSVKIKNQDQFILQALHIYWIQNYLPSHKMRSVLNDYLLKHCWYFEFYWRSTAL